VTNPTCPIRSRAAALRYVLRQSISNVTGMTNLVLAELDLARQGHQHFRLPRDLSEETSVYAVRPADVQNSPSPACNCATARLSFAPVDVTLLTLRANGKLTNLVHKGPNKWEVPTGSLGLIEPIAVEAGVGDLAEAFDVEAWVACGDQNRAQYGFTDNGTQISLDVKGRTGAELTLDFGGQSRAGSANAAVKLDGQNWIFEFPPGNSSGSTLL